MIAKKNRVALILCLVGFLCSLLLLCLPTQQFVLNLYTKKSGNTFPGDERYIAARAEVDAAMDEYCQLGLKVEVLEDQLLRETSKGTTSLMTFVIVQKQTVSAFEIFRSKLPPSGYMWVIACALLLSFVLMVLGLIRTLGMDQRRLPRLKKVLRRAACFLTLIALVTVILFSMSCTYHFYRAPALFTNGYDVADVNGKLNLWDKFLFGGNAGATTARYLAGMDFRILPTWWLIFLPLLLMLFSQIALAMGTVKKTLSRGAMYAFIVLFSLVVIYPFFVMIITGFSSPAESTDMHFLRIFPSEWKWSNLVDIANRDVFRFMGNSILLSTGATLLAMLCGIPAAYAMSRMKFAGRKAFLGFIIMSQMFSPVVLLVGISKLMNSLNLNNSLLGLIFINAAFNQAFAIWLLRGVFASISSEMEQAACIDGCGTVSALVRILIPMSAPGIVTALIFVFINAWNEYTISTVLITNRLNKPITVGLTEFSSYNMIEWHYLFAAAFLATVPVVILFLCIEKHLVSGLTSGGVKG